MTDVITPSDHAAAITAARDRLQAFATACPDQVWRAAPLGDQGDHRTVAVIVDHVADSYDYIGAWLSAIVAGEDPPVSPELVDELNAAHAADRAHVAQAEAVAHLQRSGDAVVALVGGLTVSELEIEAALIG